MTELLEKKESDFFCSLKSRENNEGLIGSAPRADVWFMLEQSGRWGTKAFDESEISESTKSNVNMQLKAIKNARLLLIKQKEKRNDGIAFFVATSFAENPELFQFNLETYDDLNELDLHAIISNPEKFKKYKVREPIFLVCTNGLRDKCCARNGIPTFQKLNEVFGESIWQSTHHGGHRFSANMLNMPYGLSFGKMDLADSFTVVEKLRGGELPLENFRGRSIYSKEIQAAESMLRSSIGLAKIDELLFTGSEEKSSDEWTVRFRNKLNEKIYTVNIKKHTSEKKAYISCIGDKQAPIVDFELLNYSQE
jgi:hypothetical protein